MLCSAVKEYKIGLSLDKQDNLTKLLISKGYDLNTLNNIGISNTNKDVYIIALRDEKGELAGYYEKHEYRTIDPEGLYIMGE